MPASALLRYICPNGCRFATQNYNVKTLSDLEKEIERNGYRPCFVCGKADAELDTVVMGDGKEIKVKWTEIEEPDKGEFVPVHDWGGD